MKRYDLTQDAGSTVIKIAEVAVETTRPRATAAVPTAATESTGCPVCDRGPTEMHAGQHVFRARGGAVTGSRPCTRKATP
jgi:hypothetical protein